jgi:hypothetical protein
LDGWLHIRQLQCCLHGCARREQSIPLRVAELLLAVQLATIFAGRISACARSDIAKSEFQQEPSKLPRKFGNRMCIFSNFLRFSRFLLS